jgi:hypothetical protein
MPAGRPRAFSSPEQLQELIDAYFAKCDARVQTRFDKEGNPINSINPEPYTMSGLALSIGVDRTTLINYSHKDEYFNTIKAAKARVEQDVERRLLETSNQTGAIFSLKNNFDGWRDKQETELSGNLSLDNNRKAVAERIIQRLTKGK